MTMGISKHIFYNNYKMKGYNNFDDLLS